MEQIWRKDVLAAAWSRHSLTDLHLLAVDIVYRFLQPSLEQPASVRLFAFLVPAMFYTLYFVDLAIVGPVIFQGGILWSVPFWAGAPVIAGITGFLLSYVMIPPAQVVEEKDKPIGVP